MSTAVPWGSAPDPEVFGGTGALLARWPGTAAATPTAPDLAMRRIAASLGRLLPSRACLRLPSIAHNSLTIGTGNRRDLIMPVGRKIRLSPNFSAGPLTDAHQLYIVS